METNTLRVLTGAAALSLFAGCGGSGNSTSDGNMPAARTLATTTVAGAEASNAALANAATFGLTQDANFYTVDTLSLIHI